MNITSACPPGDTLRTCKEIAEFYYGHKGSKEARRMHSLCRTGRFPVWRDGNVYCASKTVIRSWIMLQQQLALEGRRPSRSDIERLVAARGSLD